MALWWNGLHNALKMRPLNKVVGSNPTSATAGRISIQFGLINQTPWGQYPPLHPSSKVVTSS